MHRLPVVLLLCFILPIKFMGSVEAGTKSVTFINPGNDKGFWGNVTAIMHEASQQLGVSLEVLHSNRNRLLMHEHAKEIVSRGKQPDIVILVNELQQGSGLLKLMSEAGIPVYFLLNTLSSDQIADVARDVGSNPLVIGSIVPDNFSAGYQMLKRVVKESRLDQPRKKVSVLAILGDQLTPAALDREAGMRQAIAEMDGVELERAFSVLWDPDVAFKRVMTAMSLIDFDVIWAANDAVALASRNAVVESCGDSPCRKIPIVGLNWSPEALDAIKNGDLVSSHGGHFTAGGYAIAAIHNHLLGNPIAANVTLRMESIDASNLAQIDTVVSEQNWSNIDFTDLSANLLEPHDWFDPTTLLVKRGSEDLSVVHTELP